MTGEFKEIDLSEDTRIAIGDANGEARHFRLPISDCPVNLSLPPQTFMTWLERLSRCPL